MRFQKCSSFLTGFFLYAVPAAVFVLLSWTLPSGTYAQESGPQAAPQEEGSNVEVAATREAGSNVEVAATQDAVSSIQVAVPEVVSQVAGLSRRDIVSAPQDFPATLPEVAEILRSVELSSNADEPVLRESAALSLGNEAVLRKVHALPHEDALRSQRAARAAPAARSIRPPDVEPGSTPSNQGYSVLRHWSDLQRPSLETDRELVLSIQDVETELSWPREHVRHSSAPDLSRFWKWPLQDALAIAKGVTSQKAVMAAGGGAVLFVTARHDQELTAEMSSFNPESAQLLVKVVEEFGNVRAVRPLAAAVFLGTLMTDDHHLQDAAFTSLEAVILANLATSSLKSIFGRARPFQNKGALDFSPFSGNTSFPSGHATTAFAFVTPWLLYYPSALTPGLVVLSTGTAFTRMLTNNHWFTDVVAGSAIGFATAYLLSQRHQDEASRIRLAPSVSPDQIGLTVAVKMP